MTTSTFVSTSIPYVNAPPHVGFALELVIADVVARWRRLQGEDAVSEDGDVDYGAFESGCADLAPFEVSSNQDPGFGDLEKHFPKFLSPVL